MRDTQYSDKLLNKRVKHTPVSVGIKRVDYGEGIITGVDGDRFTVMFDSGEERKFVYPVAFKQHLELLACGKAGQVLNEYVQGDIEASDKKSEEELEKLARRVNSLSKRVESHNYFAIKLPSLDLGYCCTQPRMRENVSNKFESCLGQCSSCVPRGKKTKTKASDKTLTKKYEKLMVEFGLTGNCPASLALVNHTLEVRGRGTIGEGDVLILTYSPDSTDESTRVAFGFGVVKSAEKKSSVTTVELDLEATCILPQEDVGAKFWDVAVYERNPGEMIFSSGIMRITDMQAIQLVKMVCNERAEVDAEGSVEGSLLSQLCYYTGIAEAEIRENSGCLIDDNSSRDEIEETTEEDLDDYLPEDDYGDKEVEMY